MSALACDAQDQADLFVATLGDQTLDEAMANLEHDATLYGWPRLLVRFTAARVRALYVRRGGQAEFYERDTLPAPPPEFTS